MKPILRRAAAAMLAGVAALALTSGPAQAETRTFHDGVKADGPDVKWARVNHGKTRVNVRSDVGVISLGDLYTLWIDTRSSDPGPEYKMEMSPNSDDLGLRAVETFKSRGTAVEDCNFQAQADAFGDTPEIYFSVPRACIGNPKKVRISLRARFMDPEDSSYSYDWLPKARAFTGWVAR